MPLVQTRGAASAQGFGEFAQAATAVNYIEEVFSCFLYTGNSSTQTITNGIDLSTKGGLVWVKNRDSVGEHALFDTVRGVGNWLTTNSTVAQYASTSTTAFLSSGFSLANGTYVGEVNQSTRTYASWTFRKQPKFFDVVTYEGDGDTNERLIPHSLNSVPGCVIVKRTDVTGSWAVWHRAGGTTTARFFRLNGTAGAGGSLPINQTGMSSTNFGVYYASERVISDSAGVGFNVSGAIYVAYVFAHDAGGFGLTGTDNVISCGSFTTDGSGNATVSLGYEPQLFLAKKSSSTGNWFLADTMRGFTPAAPSGADTFIYLLANTSDAEAGGDAFRLNSTGVDAVTGVASETYIYIAIRRGPMKVPTSGTSVFGLSARTGTGANATVTGGQTDDLVVIKDRVSAVLPLWSPRLAGTGYLGSSSNQAEIAAGITILQANPWDVMDGVKIGTTNSLTNNSSDTYINYLFKRAPSFMDVVCYTGDGVSARVVTHNLGVQPEFIAIKRRSATGNWICNSKLASGDYVRGQGDPNSTATTTNMLGFNSATGANQTLDLTGYVTSTGIQLNVLSQGGSPNTSASTYVAYLFATCAGVSKIFSYTGNGSSQTINCGFTAGSRWVMIKRTDSTGDWYVWDSARGIVAGNDPHLSLNSTAAEVTTDDSVDTDNTGFIVNQLSATNVNVTSATYIGIAIA